MASVFGVGEADSPVQGYRGVQVGVVGTVAFDPAPDGLLQDGGLLRGGEGDAHAGIGGFLLLFSVVSGVQEDVLPAFLGGLAGRFDGDPWKYGSAP